MKWNSIVVVTALAMIATSASALPVIDMSLSAGLNHSRLDASTNYPSTSHSGTKPRVTFNASVGPLIGVELGWSKLATNTTAVTVVPPGGAGGGGSFEDELRESGSAFWLVYAPSIEFGPIELTGKLGAARVTREVVIAGFGIDIADGENEALVGLAGTYWFTSLIGVRVDAERIGSDASQLGLSLTIGF
ncbi:MAG: hypothetical protein WD081_02930 [Gammaproteobacteria bacterium]